MNTNTNRTTKTKKATNGTAKAGSTTSTKPVTQPVAAKAAPASVIAAKPAISSPALAATPNVSPATGSSAPTTLPLPLAASPAKPAPVKELNPAPKTKVALELINPTAKSVAVAGSFNGWNPARTPLKPAGQGKWVGELTGVTGRHEYLFVVDGQWMLDPKAKESVQNPFGGRNSVLVAPGN